MQAKQRLSELVVDDDPRLLPVVPVVITASAPATAIVDYANDKEIDLIVIRHPGSWRRRASPHGQRGGTRCADRAVSGVDSPASGARLRHHGCTDCEGSAMTGRPHRHYP
jgi:hypothetical protein